MKLGVFTVLFAEKTLPDVLKYVKDSGLDTIELGTGNYPGGVHCPVHEILPNESKIQELKQMVADSGLEISALSCHGNPIHPNSEVAKEHYETHRKTIELASKLGVNIVVGFSGCPGSHENDKYPNWVTCPWPPDFLDVVTWQWDKKVIPFWKEQNQIAMDHGVRIALEPHPGFVVYNCETMIRLHQEAGDNIGCNFDPSHFFWQGMDPIAMVRNMGTDVIFHVHAKDSRVYPTNADLNGTLDTKPYADEINRSWIFRTIGYGHDLDWWKNFISTLRMVGYDGPVSIEHEDSLMSNNEGFQKAVAILKEALLYEKPGEMWWV